MFTHKFITYIVFICCISTSIMSVCMTNIEDFAGLETQEAAECSICLEAFNDNDEITKFPCECRSAYHHGCLDNWRKNSRTQKIDGNSEDKCLKCDHKISIHTFLPKFKYKDAKAFMAKEYKTPAMRLKEKQEIETAAALAKCKAQEENEAKFKAEFLEQQKAQLEFFEKQKAEMDTKKKDKSKVAHDTASKQVSESLMLSEDNNHKQNVASKDQTDKSLLVATDISCPDKYLGGKLNKEHQSGEIKKAPNSNVKF